MRRWPTRWKRGELLERAEVDAEMQRVAEALN
jgi:hypothetical protein